MQRFDRNGPAARSWSTNTSAREPYNDSIDVEAVALGNSVVNNPISPNPGSNARVQAKIRFGTEVEFSFVLREDERTTWGELRTKATKHPLVQKAFQNHEKVKSTDFALVVANGTEDQEELLISSTSKLCSEAIDLRQFEQGRVLGRGQSRSPEHSAQVQVLLLYAPNIHLCTFDGLTISLPSLGHWLHVHDTKGQQRLAGIESLGSDALVNSLLLKKENSSVFGSFLARLNKFMRGELKLNANEYAASVPFGKWADCKSQLHARVQLANPKILWSLLANFEQDLKRDDRNAHAAYLVHQRETWATLRFADYRRWAGVDSIEVQREYNALCRGTTYKAAGARLPSDFYFDGGRMQIHYTMNESLDTMHGAMGSISQTLLSLIDNYVSVANMLHVEDFYLIIHGQRSHFSLNPVKYMKILVSNEESAKDWAAKLLESVQSPERLYSGLLAEGAGLAPSTVEGIVEAAYGDESGQPALSKQVMAALLDRNKTDRRLFIGVKPTSGPLATGMRKSVIKPRVLHQKGPVMEQKGYSGGNRSERDANNWRAEMHQNQSNGKWQRASEEPQSNWRDKRQTASNLAMQADGYRKQEYRGGGYLDYDQRESSYNRYDRDYEPGMSSRRRGDLWENGRDRDSLSRNMGGMSIRDNDDGGYSDYQHNSGRSYKQDSSIPGPGYVCRVCGQVGGGPESHWFQQCPVSNEANRNGIPTSALGASKRPPGQGYVCKICGQKGGSPGAHWVQQCTAANDSRNKDNEMKSNHGGGFGEFWKDRSPATSSWSF